MKVNSKHTDYTTKRGYQPKKLGLFGMTLLIILSSCVAVLSPLLTPKAFAATPTDVLNAGRAWSILNAVIDGRSLMDSSISNSDVDKCHIFGNDDNDDIYVGSHVTGNSSSDTINGGLTQGGDWDELENNTGIATGALASVGISGGCRGLLEAIGYTSSGGGMEQPDDFGNKLSERIRNALKANAFFGANIGDGNPGAAISYAILDYYLKNVCGWQYRNPFVNNDKAQTDAGRRNREAQANGWSGDTGNAHFQTYTYEAGKAGSNTYFKGGGTQNDVYVGSKTGFASSGANNASIDCADNNADTIGAKLGDNHRFADAYAALVKPGGDNTPGTCKDRYNGKPQQLAACDAGFKNKGTPNYCAITYPPVPIQDTDDILREACLYGFGTATGGANQTTPPPGSTPEGAEDKTTCAITGVGWIVCPIVTFLATIVDAAYSVVASLLTVQPLMSTGGSAIFDAWSVMRNFANVSFVIAFLIIIFSQISSVGISNYGIKKLLPKLVVAAILVNVSFWVCAIAVDLSNIFGSSLNNLLVNVQQDLGLSKPTISEFSTGEGWAGIAGVLIAGGVITGVAFFVGLSALLPMLIAALVAIVTVFLVLTLRQALIILLIVVSPLAFVAYLLPNTESLFKKWLDLFKTLLLMYPIISLIFGASALASTVVMTSAHGDYAVAIQIMGAAITVIPLAITPIVMKTAGGVLNRFGGFINNPNKGPFDRMKKGAEGYRKNRQMLRDTKALGDDKYRFGQSFTRRKARRGAVIASREAGLKDTQTNYIANQAAAKGEGGLVGDNKFARQMAGGGVFTKPNEAVQAAVVASAVNQQKKAFYEDVSNMEALVKIRFEKPEDALADAIKRGDQTQAVAAQNLLIKSGGSGVNKMRETIEKAEADPGSQAGLEAVNGALRTNVKDNHGQYVKSKSADVMQWAGDKSKSLTDSSIGSLSDVEIASQTAPALEKAVSQGKVSSEQARSVLTDPRVSANLTKEHRAALTRAAGGDLRPTPSKEDLAAAHEEAIVIDHLGDMDKRGGGGGGA